MERTYEYYNDTKSGAFNDSDDSLTTPLDTSSGDGMDTGTSSDCSVRGDAVPEPWLSMKYCGECEFETYHAPWSDGTSVERCWQCWKGRTCFQIPNDGLHCDVCQKITEWMMDVKIKNFVCCDCRNPLK